MSAAAPLSEADAEAIAKLFPRLNDPVWRLSNLYKIVVKEEGIEDDEEAPGLVIPFVPNSAQRKLLRRLHTRNIVLKCRQRGFCLDPDTRVLTADLRWVRIADMQPGDEVVGVDEHPAGGSGSSRKMRAATVQAAVEVRRMAYRVTFDDGRSVVCTDQHPWLSRPPSYDQWDWRSIKSREGQGPKMRLQVGYHVRWITKPWGDGDMEDGWFGGMLDGEGSIGKPNAPPKVNVCQRPGPVWDRLVKYAEDRGYNPTVEGDTAERPSKFGKVPVPKLVFARMDELFRVIGQTRPTRFIANRWWEGRYLPGRRNGEAVGVATIVSIEQLGEQTMIDLQTSTGTYIAEGFVSHNTTLVAILWLDTALFSKGPVRCGIIAHEREAAEAIFRDKVVFAYNNMPDELRAVMPIESKNKTEIVFKHNMAGVRVATSMRSGTIHRLHVSEFGKICAKYPAKAREVLAGSIPAVPGGGIIVIESTAEGQDGPFFDMTQRALGLQQQRSVLSRKDYRLTFAPWWEAAEYSMEPENTIISEAQQNYFNRLEIVIGYKLTEGQRAWYVATLENDFAGEQPMMWQEYPSTPQEAFAVSTEGCYYATQLAAARRAGRVRPGLPIEAAPVYTFWDLGRGDMTTIWLMQKIGPDHRFIGYYENSGEELDHYVEWLQKRPKLVYGRHFLPHEAAYKRLGERKDTNRSLQEGLELLWPGQRFEIVPRITNIQSGIQSTREAFASSWFDEEACKDGLPRLANYRKQWDKVRGRWTETPMHDDNSHGADGYRQFGQVLAAGEKFAGLEYRPPGAAVRGSTAARWRKRGGGSAMAA